MRTGATSGTENNAQSDVVERPNSVQIERNPLGQMIIDGSEQRLGEVRNCSQINVAGDEQNWSRSIGGV